MSSSAYPLGGGNNSVATDTFWSAKGRIAVATADNTAVELAPGANGYALRTRSSETTGLIYLPSLPYAWGVGEYITQPSSGYDSAAASNGYCHYIFFPVPFDTTVDRIAIRLITDGSAGSVQRLGLYAPKTDGTYGPGALLVDGGTVNTASGAPVVREATISQAVTVPGVWVAVAGQGAPATDPILRRVSFSAPQLCVSPTASEALGNLAHAAGFRLEMGVTGALPANAAGAFPPGGGNPMVALRRA